MSVDTMECMYRRTVYRWLSVHRHWVLMDHLSKQCMCCPRCVMVNNGFFVRIKTVNCIQVYWPNLSLFSSSTWVHPSGHLGHGHPVPGQVWYGQDGCVCTGHPAADWTCGRAGECLNNEIHLYTGRSHWIAVTLKPIPPGLKIAFNGESIECF